MQSATCCFSASSWTLQASMACCGVLGVQAATDTPTAVRGVEHAVLHRNASACTGAGEPTTERTGDGAAGEWRTARGVTGGDGGTLEDGGLGGVARETAGCGITIGGAQETGALVATVGPALA